MLGQIKLFMLLIGYIHSNCSPGCLKCEYNSQCYACDFVNNKFLEYGQCIQRYVLNCQEYNHVGSCLSCQKNYFLSEFNTCQQIMETNIVSNCLLYASLFECLTCENGYEIKEGKCEQPTVFIENCQDYDKLRFNFCTTCGQGYQYNSELNQCDEIGQLTNCAVHSKNKCVSCKEGYKLDRNYYFREIFDFEAINSQSKLFDFLNIIQRSKFESYRFSKCVQDNLPNCSKISDKDNSKCEICSSNFYLDENFACQEFPLEPIHKCLLYSSQTACIECKQGFYLKTSSSCDAVTNVENCKLYGTSLNISKCIECQNEFYIDIQGECIERVNSLTILSCLKFELNSDKCQECFENYIISADQLLCDFSVLNCETYSLGSTCSLCIKGYWLDITKNNCVSGTVRNCEEYQVTNNNCSKCLNGFYLLNNYCEKHDPIENCLEFDSIQKNQCSNCISPYILLTKSNHCIERYPLKNCEEYSDSTNGSKCEKCLSGFAVNNNFECEKFKDVNCLQINNTDCTVCREGFQLWQQTGKCVEPLIVVRNFCKEINTTNPMDFTCENCYIHSLAIHIPKMNICVPNNEDYFEKINFCIRYELVANTFSCIECQSPFFLLYDVINSEYTCSSTCTENHNLVKLQFDNVNFTTTKKLMNICEQLNIDNCEKAIQITESNAETYICAKCKTDPNANNALPFINFLNGQQSYINNHIAYVNRVTNVIEYGASFINTGLSCGKHDPGDEIRYNTTGNSAEISNCEFFEQTSAMDELIPVTLYLCIRCVFGTTGPLKDDYIESCASIIEHCDDSVQYMNLLNPKTGTIEVDKEPLSIYASCYQCLGNRLPTLFLKDNTSRYVFVEEPFLTQPSVLLNQCVEVSHEGFGLDPNTVFDSVVPNCGYVIYLLQEPVQTDIGIAAPSIICGACKPGFLPTFTNEMITGCTLILNCDVLSEENVIFNACNKCDNNYQNVWDDALKKFDYSQCEDNPLFFCKAYDSATSKCKICKLGYNLNQDDECELISLDLCRAGTFQNSTLPFNNVTPNLSYNIFRATIGHGCTLCEGDFVKAAIDQPMCINSPYLQSTTTLPLTTTYIPHCFSYQVLNNNQLLCNECDYEHVIKNNFTECILMGTDLVGCQVAVADGVCQTCKLHHVLVGNLCEIQQLLNCINYQQGALGQTCLQCGDQTYLENGACIFGDIQGCKTYVTSSQCTECLHDYKLINVENGTYCFLIPFQEKCIEYTAGFQNKDIECSKCKKGFTLSTNPDDFLEKVCWQALPVQNCLEYDLEANFTNSTMKCSLCNHEYYLLDGLCNRRNNLDEDCIEFRQDADECLQCDLQNYLSADQFSCVSFPNGIHGCSIYSGPKTCFKCKNSFYLLENECQVLLVEELLNNCLSYDGKKKCLDCKNNFFLKEQECIAIVALNCLEYESESKCKSCTDNSFGLFEENGVVNCQPKNIANCILSTDTQPFKCLECKVNYFPFEESCSAVVTLIHNCGVYVTEELCGKCLPGNMISIDQKTCLPVLSYPTDINCEVFEEIAEANCEVCELGFFFDEEGNCVACQDNSVQKGCLQCDPRDQKQCYLCAYGYFQKDFNGDCLKDIVQMTVNEEDEFAAIKNFLTILILIVY